MLPDCDAMAISIAETAAEITTGKTPPSTPRNFTLESSFDLVSRSDRILAEIHGDCLAREKHRQQDISNTGCGK
jgi:hypothetical protein